jgi:hypothetical protein
MSKELLKEARNYVVSYIKQDENAGPYESGAKAARDLLARIDKHLAPPEFCDVCPHALLFHNPDGSCGCGVNCAVDRAARTKVEGK